MTHSLYAVVVMDGFALEYAPELYESAGRAELEASRWAWILSGTGWLDIEQPFEGRWVVGDRDVRLVPVEAAEGGYDDLWVGQFWTKDGWPDPEAIVLAGRDAARAWVFERPIGAEPAAETINESWFVATTYRYGDEEAYAVASLAKYIVG